MQLLRSPERTVDLSKFIGSHLEEVREELRQMNITVSEEIMPYDVSEIDINEIRTATPYTVKGSCVKLIVDEKGKKVLLIIPQNYTTAR